jgi:hypothetical protein
MQLEELEEIRTYLADPNRNLLIEAEMSNSRRDSFVNQYEILTGNYPLPQNENEVPFLVLDPGSNKWGLELRGYFNSDDNIPDSLQNLCIANNRPGYEQFNTRLNNNEVILYLFENGFILGNQDYNRI